MRLSLHNPDLTTAKRVAAVINDFIGGTAAESTDPRRPRPATASELSRQYHPASDEVEQLRVDPDQRARIVIDERSGIIVMGKDVKVSTVAVAQGNLTVTITESPVVSQPNPLAEGETVVVPRTNVQVDTGEGNSSQS